MYKDTALAMGAPRLLSFHRYFCNTLNVLLLVYWKI